MIYQVYVKTNDSNVITAVDSSGFLADTSGWILIDEGSGDRFYLAQGNYFGKHIRDDRGIWRYKLEDGKAVERTQEEMDADYIEPEVRPTQDQRIEDIEAAINALLDGINA